MNDYIRCEIENIISKFRQLPFLFVGTGLSMRYGHAPGWNELLYDIWKIVNPSKKERDYEKLRQGIEMDVDSQFFGLTSEEKKYHVNPILASYIEKDFRSLYYSSDGFDTAIFTESQNDEIIINKYNPFAFKNSKFYSYKIGKKATKYGM